MKRTISSDLTFTLKVLLPCCLLVGWVVSILNLFLGFLGESVYRFVTPLLIAIVVAFYWELIQIKRVRLDEQFLYVSNYLVETRVPLERIGEVVEKHGVNVHLVTVYPKVNSQAERAIRFLPKAFQASSVVDDLRQIVEAQ